MKQLVNPSFVKSVENQSIPLYCYMFESDFSKSSGAPTITSEKVPCEERLTHSPGCNYVSQASPFDPPTPSPTICIYIRLIINNHVMRSHVLVMSSSQLAASSKQMRYITCYLLQLKFWFSVVLKTTVVIFLGRYGCISYLLFCHIACVKVSISEIIITQY